jgi:hypothetical protein
MPRIPDEMQDSVVFLYPDEASARKGKPFGGTGFLVDYPGKLSSRPHRYLVTNMHVAHHDPNGLVVRVNTSGSEPDVLHIPEPAWVDHPDGDDIAVIPIDLDRASGWAAQALVWQDIFGHSREENIARFKELNVGTGDDVVMLGRFVGHDGRQRNQPLARFGNIAMMPGEPVMDGRNIKVVAFLVEMRSLSGFSGSPVFLYLGPGSYRGQETGMMPFYSETIALLGIDTGHKQVRDKVYYRNTERDVVNEEWEVRQNSGVAVVSPVWEIRKTLEREDLVNQRDKADTEWLAEHAHELGQSDLASEGDRDRFENLSKALVNVPKSEVEKLREQEKGPKPAGN